MVASLPDSASLLAEDRRIDRRSARWASLYILWQISRNSRVRGCRRTGVLAQGAASVRISDGPDRRTAGFGGLSTCGSVWGCPCCAERILAGRQAEMTQALAAWVAGGGRVAMLTLTMRHRAGQRLADLWDGVSRAWGRVAGGKSWMTDQLAYGAPVWVGDQLVNRIQWVKVVEVTHGSHGWHVHIHVALLLPGDATQTDVDLLGSSMFQRWASALRFAGFQTPLARSGGLDARLWRGDDSNTLADYFAKNRYRSAAETAAAELGRPDWKAARGTNRTPFQILAAIVEDFRADDGDLWAEWESASHGRRQVAWSKGTRDRLGVGLELTDEELAEESDLGGTEVAVITARGLATMAAGRHGPAVLAAAEQSGSVGVRLVLDHFGIQWLPPTASLLAAVNFRR